MQLAGRRYDNGQPVWIEINDRMITDAGPWRGGDRSVLPWLAPGLVDLQVNGYGGLNFTDPNLTMDAAEEICHAMDPAGVTGFLATVITHGHDLLTSVLATIAEAIQSREGVRRRALGIHLEGPFISPEEGPRGAHPLEFCRPPDWEEFETFQRAARGHIRMVTLSPEYAGAIEFIDRLAKSGVLVSIGHTNAQSEQISAAVDAGARLSTHLGNGAHGHIRRHPNYIWDQLADDRLTATLIVDGHHLPPSVVKSLVRGKAAERVVLISDITGIAGTVASEPGVHELAGLGTVEVLGDGRVVVAGQREYLAGATCPLRVGVTNVMRFADVDLAAAIEMASARPASLLQLDSGRLEVGAEADLIQFDMPDNGGSIEIRATVNDGECVFGEVFEM